MNDTIRCPRLIGGTTGASGGGRRMSTTAVDPTPVLTQKEAATLLRVSVSYLRQSDCPKLLLPGRGKRPLVRYYRIDLLAWAAHWRAA